MPAQTNQSQFYATGVSEDYTPSSAVTAGTPLNIGNRAAVAANDIAAGVKGAVQVQGLFKIVQAAEIIPIDADVWWDADGDPVGGTTGTGAATATPQAAADGFFLGSCREASVATDAVVIVDLNGKTKQATIAAAAGTDATLIDAIVAVLQANGMVAGA